MLIVDPAVAVISRTHACVQFGIDAPVILSGLSDSESALLDALRLGIEEHDLIPEAQQLGVEADRAHELCRLLTDAGVLVVTQVPGASAPWRLRTWAAQNSADPLDLAAKVRRSPVYAIGPFKGEFASAAEAAGMRAAPADSSNDPRIHPGSLVILTAVWMPDLLSADSLYARDIDHVHAVIGDHFGTVGGVVVPGASPCSHCGVRWAKQHDPGWLDAWKAVHRSGPRPSQADPALVAITAAHTASRLRADRAGMPGLHRKLIVSDWGIEEDDVAFHPDCRCRQGSETTPAAAAVMSNSSDPNCASLTDPSPGIRAS